MTYETILDTMIQEFTSRAGFAPDDASDLGVRMKVLASQLYELWLRSDYLLQQMFPQTAQGEYLDLHGQTRGITRREAAPAKGLLTFSRQTASSQDIVIPAATVCSVSRDPSLRFETTQEAVLQAGELQVTVPANSLEGGAAYNVAAGQIDVLVTPPQGISHVTNNGRFTGGVDREEDEDFHNRIISSFQVISNGTNTAYYYDEAMKYEGVLSVKVLPRARGRGTVDVVVKAKDGIDEEALLAQIGEDFTRTKEINVDVQVRVPRITVQPCKVKIAVLDGHAFQTVETQVRQAAEHFFAGIGVGNPVYRAALISALYAVPGVANCQLILPVEDLPQDGDGLFVLGEITVEELALQA